MSTVAELDTKWTERTRSLFTKNVTEFHRVAKIIGNSELVKKRLKITSEEYDQYLSRKEFLKYPVRPLLIQLASDYKIEIGSLPTNGFVGGRLFTESQKIGYMELYLEELTTIEQQYLKSERTRLGYLRSKDMIKSHVEDFMSAIYLVRELKGTVSGDIFSDPQMDIHNYCLELFKRKKYVA